MNTSELTIRFLAWLKAGLRFGETKRSWRSYRIPGRSDCDRGVLMIGGLSSNAASSNRVLADTLHHERVLTWSRNLYGHTGRYSDFSRARFWHWIVDGALALRKLVKRNAKSDIILVGHSTGGLVVLALLTLYRLFPTWLVGTTEQVSIRAVLVFPPFRLQRRRDTQLLWIVAVLYYLVCPAAFVLLALSGKWMWPLAVLAYVCHVALVPKISVPSGDERARQAGRKRRRLFVSESVLLAILSIYFVAAPPVIAVVAELYPGLPAISVFGLFITTLIVPLLVIPRNPTEAPVCIENDGTISNRRHSGYRWLPVITAANLVIFQFVLKPFLKFCRQPILVLEGGNDQVVQVDQSWIQRLQPNVKFQRLEGVPHSDLSPSEQQRLGEFINQWLVMPGSRCDEGVAVEPITALS